MTRTTRGTVSILIAILLMGIVFYSSSMPYHDQSLVSKIQQLLSFQPFSDVLSTFILLMKIKSLVFID